MSATEPSAADRSVVDRPAVPSDAGAAESASTGPRTTDAAPPRPSTAFPREARLLDKSAYDAVFGDNRRLADRYWTILVHTPSSAQEPAPPPDEANRDARTGARLGLAIAKKRARRAVDRNRIKRVARESFRHARASLGERRIVIMNRDAARDAGAAELRRALDALWTRLLRQSPSGRSRGDGKRVP